jgi:membrane protease YdiL (CAAX protease family)
MLLKEMPLESAKNLRKTSATGDLLALAIIFVGATLFGALCLLALKPFFPEAASAEVENGMGGGAGDWLTLVAYCAQFAAAIVAAHIYLRRKSTTLQAGGPAEKPVESSAPAGALLRNAPLTLWGLITVAAASVTIEPLMGLFPEKYLERLGEAIGSGGVTIFLLVVIAPVAEELFFRGIVLKRLGLSWSPWRAVVASALFFGLVHLPVWPQMVNAAVMGVVLGYVYVLTRSLAPVVVIHAINNGLAYLSLEIAGTQSDGLMEMTGGGTTYWIVYSACAAVAAVSLPAMIIMAGKKHKVKKR